MPRRFFRLTFYNILANVTAPLVGLVDVAMLGHLPDIRFLAGVALGGVIFDFLYWTLAFLRMGTTGITAQAIGRSATGRAAADEIHFILARFLILAAVIASLLFALRSPLGKSSFELLSGEPEVEAAGREYYDARILGVPAVVANLVFMGWFLGREESRQVLVMTVIANLVNVGLNYLLIFRLELATRGAGLASAASQYLMLAIAVWLYFRGRDLVASAPLRDLVTSAPLRGDVASATVRKDVAWSWAKILDRDRWRQMAHLNRDILIRTLSLVTSFAIFTNISSILGVTLLAVNTLLLKISTLAAFLIDGAAFAIESLAGVFSGSGQSHELRRLLRLALLSSLAFAAPFVLVVVLIPKTVLGLLTSHAEVINLGSVYRWWMVPVLLFGAVAYIYDGLFLGLTEGGKLRNAMLVSTLAVFLPIALLALWYRAPHLLWLAMAAFMLARAVTLEIARRTLPAFAREDG